jgi:NitT/TauT family transport system substrate-binding protein
MKPMKKTIPCLLRSTPLVLLASAVTALVICWSSRALAQASKPLTPMQFAAAVPNPNPLFINIEIGKVLGFFAEEGIDASFLYATANSAVTILIDQGKAQVGVGTPNFQVTYAAQGHKLPGIDFYEYAAPLKWDIAIAPDAPYTSIAQLTGKKLGIIGRGTADENVAKSFLELSGVKPSDVTFIVVGQGSPGGVALKRGQIDAMLAWDTTLGQWEVAGIGYKLLPRPKNLKPVGGFYIQAKPEFIRDHRALAVGFGRAVAKATVFALANPRAAADAYLKLHPIAAGQGKSKAETIDSIVKIVGKRAVHWLHEGKDYTNPKDFLGEMSLQEWKNEVEFADAVGKVKDPRIFFTNELIKEINNFDRQAIIAKAKAYKIQP